MKTVLLLVISNIFMTIAWYGHLKYRSKPLIWVILISWAVRCLSISSSAREPLGLTNLHRDSAEDHAGVASLWWFLQ